MTYTQRLFAEPYDVDPDDRAARGRLLHAAASGDKRARATLAKMPAATPAASEPRSGAVDLGRALYRGTTKPRGEE